MTSKKKLLLEKVDVRLAESLCVLLKKRGWDVDYQKSSPVSNIYISEDTPENLVERVKWPLDQALDRDNNGIGVHIKSESWLKGILPRSKNAPSRQLSADAVSALLEVGAIAGKDGVVPIGETELRAVKTKKHLTVYARKRLREVDSTLVLKFLENRVDKLEKEVDDLKKKIE